MRTAFGLRRNWHLEFCRAERTSAENGGRQLIAVIGMSIMKTIVGTPVNDPSGWRLANPDGDFQRAG